GVGAARRLALELAPGGIRGAVELVEVDDDVVRDAVVRTGVLRIDLVDVALPVAVQQRDLVGEHVVGAEYQVCAVVHEIPAGGDRGLGLARIALLGDAGGQRGTDAVHALLHHHVHRAGDRVGAVDGRG